jgi:hypothetical protein
MRSSRQLLPMRLDWQITKNMVRRHFALLLLLWWGGLNCLTGCLTSLANFSGESHCPTSGEGGDCCRTPAGDHGAHSSSTIGSPSTSLPSSICCSLLSLSAEVRREDVQAVNGSMTAAIESRIEHSLERRSSVQFLNRRIRLPDRGGTYLLHCVFLI